MSLAAENTHSWGCAAPASRTSRIPVCILGRTRTPTDRAYRCPAQLSGQLHTLCGHVIARESTDESSPAFFGAVLTFDAETLENARRVLAIAPVIARKGRVDRIAWGRVEPAQTNDSADGSHCARDTGAVVARGTTAEAYIAPWPSTRTGAKRHKAAVAEHTRRSIWQQGLVQDVVRSTSQKASGALRCTALTHPVVETHPVGVENTTTRPDPRVQLTVLHRRSRIRLG